VAGIPHCGADHDRDGDEGAHEDGLSLLQGGEVSQEVLAEGLGGGLDGPLVLAVHDAEDGEVAAVGQDVRVEAAGPLADDREEDAELGGGGASG